MVHKYHACAPIRLRPLSAISASLLVERPQVFIEEVASQENEKCNKQDCEDYLRYHNGDCLTSTNAVNAHQCRDVDDDANNQKNQGDCSTQGNRQEGLTG